jgi:hypothetical protein
LALFWGTDAVKRGILITSALGLALIPQVAVADTLAYLRASSQLDRDTHASKYHPLNLVDDDPSTSWCEGADGLGEGEEIRFFFKKSQKIDRIIVGPSDTTGRLIEEVKVSDGINSVRIRLRGVYAEMTLKRPLAGTTFVVTIELVGGPNKNAPHGPDVACLSEVLLFWKKRPFGGRMPLSRLRFNEHRDHVLGTWNGEPLGAPERFITFSLDGTWAWKRVPLLGGKTVRRTGEYRFRGSRLLMRQGETGRWADMRFKHRRVIVDPENIGAPLGDYEVITFGAKVLGNEIAGEYNNAKF